jgi:hypothetical protein
MNYEDDLRIDESALDVEWLDQPSLMFKFAKSAAAAQREMDEAKEAIDVVKAELDLDIRNNPEKYDLAKITEGAITNTILTQEKYKEALAFYNQKKFEYNVIKGATNAVDARKTALENLVKLHGQQYFAGPKIPRDLSFEWEQREKQKKSNQVIRMKRRPQ